MRLTRRAVIHRLLAGGTLAVAACASAGTAGESRRVDQNLLTREEMATVDVSNLYDVVERLRPRWLQIRAPKSINSTTEIVVYMGQSYLGGPDVLRQFNMNTVAQLRYLDAAKAYATLSGIGGRSVEGAIIIDVS